MSGPLTVVQGVTFVPDAEPGTVSFEEFKSWLRGPRFLRHLAAHDEVRLRTYRLETLARPYALAVLLGLVSRGRVVFEDATGRAWVMDRAARARLRRRLLADWRGQRRLLRETAAAAERLLAERRPAPRLALDAGRAAYLRTDLAFGIASGGSVGHIAGVLNNLDAFTGAPIFLTTDRIATVRAEIETHVVTPDGRFADFGELPGFAFNRTLEAEARRRLDGQRLSLVYQRYSTNNYTGARLARHYGVPFVLEYNGSEIWIARNWGKPFRHEALSERIELANLHAADLVVVVSRPMQDELVARGIPAERILVNPNGVDPERYSPEVDGSAVRARYGLGEHLVIGFIGTFGRWHGAEVLAEAFGRLLQAEPSLRARLRLLMIGDGVTLPECRARLARLGALEYAVFTGRTAQVEGPAHLAACDVLASPHVPNTDGTPFFGSPTKLFEYMAMGKGIVASDLDQIGEVLEHDRTAWLVPPGDVAALGAGLARLAADRTLRERLGAAARETAVARYTWREHTRRIVERLAACCAA